MNKVISTFSMALFAWLSLSAAAQDFTNVKIDVEKASGNVYMLTGSGGNIGVLATEKGLLLVDDQFQPLAERIEQAMNNINNHDLKYVVNTHYHGDHTGSNSFFSHKAPIFAHENVRTRLKENEKRTVTDLPVVTYKDGITIYLDNETIKLTHLPSGHTDGDTIVYFEHANVLHTGDLFFEIGFPYIDLDGGGSVKGYLANVKYMIDHTPENVVIIPGHGKLTNKAGLIAFANMIDFSIKRVESAIANGLSNEEIISAGIGDQYKNKSWQFITEEIWLNTLITDLRK